MISWSVLNSWLHVACHIAFLTDEAADLLFQAEGYKDGDLTLYYSFTAMSFLKAENAVDFLDKASEVRSLSYFTLSKTDAGSPLFLPFHRKSCCVYTVNCSSRGRVLREVKYVWLIILELLFRFTECNVQWLTWGREEVGKIKLSYGPPVFPISLSSLLRSPLTTQTWSFTRPPVLRYGSVVVTSKSWAAKNSGKSVYQCIFVFWKIKDSIMHMYVLLSSILTSAACFWHGGPSWGGSWPKNWRGRTNHLTRRSSKVFAAHLQKATEIFSCLRQNVSWQINKSILFALFLAWVLMKKKGILRMNQKKRKRRKAKKKKRKTRRKKWKINLQNWKLRRYRSSNGTTQSCSGLLFSS